MKIALVKPRDATKEFGTQPSTQQSEIYKKTPADEHVP